MRAINLVEMINMILCWHIGANDSSSCQQSISNHSTTLYNMVLIDTRKFSLPQNALLLNQLTEENTDVRSDVQ